MSCIIHEIGHSEVASYLGDKTARYQGRSSLNPFKHLTLSGFRKIPIRLTDNTDLLIVSIAGITTNLVIIFLAALFLIVKEFQILNIIIWVNIVLVVINAIPMRFKGITTDGYKIMKHIINRK